jgi:phage terminase large subunit-like protein
LIDISTLSKGEQVELLKLYESYDYIVSGKKITSFYANEDTRKKYTKQMEFYKLGTSFDQRLFMAANRSGKTVSGAFEVSCHATGIYPEWWEGKRFDKPINICVVGQNSKTVRDILQQELCGKFSELGTGMLPRDSILKVNKSQGLADCIESLDIKSAHGGRSTLYFKSYEQGRKSFEGTIYDLVWMDEEGPEDIYAEILTRTATVEGILIITFTPLEGPTNLVLGFMNADPKSGKTYVNQTWDDVPHLTEKVKEQLLASYPPYQRDARSKGIPMLGAGAIYPVKEEDVVIKPMEIPKHWKKIYGLDVGRNTAAAWIAIDPDTDIYYVYSDYKRVGEIPLIHAESIKSRGAWIPGVIDYAGVDQSDGQKLKDIYTGHGLNVENANKAVEAGIYAVWERLSLGKLKIFDNCQALLQEFRLYRRDEKGRIVKKDDHIMDAFRYAVMSAGTLAKTQLSDTQKRIGINPYTRTSL